MARPLRLEFFGALGILLGRSKNSIPANRYFYSDSDKGERILLRYIGCNNE